MEVISAANGRVKGSADYTWRCFGDASRYLDIGNEESGQQASVIFDTDDGTVYAMEIFLLQGTTAFRWLDDRYTDLFLKECSERNVDPSWAFDNVKFQNITSVEALMVLDEITKDLDQVTQQEDDDDPT